MSKYDYELSKQLHLEILKYDPTDRALLMAVMRRADSDTLERLKFVFSDVWQELSLRYNAPGGWLPEEIHPFLVLNDEEVCRVCGRTDEDGH